MLTITNNKTVSARASDSGTPSAVSANLENNYFAKSHHRAKSSSSGNTTIEALDTKRTKRKRVTTGSSDDITPTLVDARDHMLVDATMLVGVGLPANDPLVSVLRRSEMGRLTLDHDWARTSLGAMSTWGPELRTTVSLVMQSPFRAALWCGDDLTMLYNDPYIPAVGRKHPDRSFGLAGAVAWGELWDVLGPVAATLFEGKVSHAYDQLFLMELSNETRVNETYYSWSWIPTFNADGKFVAAVNDSFETTERVLSERRLGTLRDLALTTARAETVEAYFKCALESLARNPYDLPFVLCYSAGIEQQPKPRTKDLAPSTSSASGRCHLRLSGTIGVPEGHASAPQGMHINLGSPPSSLDSNADSSASSQTLTFRDMSDSADAWPFKEALATRKSIYISDLRERNEGFELRGWPEPSRNAVVIPIMTETDTDPQAVFVVGLNPRRPWSDSEGDFLQLLAKQFSTGISSAKSFEEANAKALSLARLDAAKTAFFSNISHELRQPLQLILGPLEDVLADKTNTLPHHQHSLSVISRHAQRLLRLVNSC